MRIAGSALFRRIWSRLRSPASCHRRIDTVRLTSRHAQARHHGYRLMTLDRALSSFGTGVANPR